MRKNKVIAAMLAATMLAGVFTGCSKTTKTSEDDFIKACEKLELDEFEFDGYDFPETGDLEGGIYFVADEDQIEEFADAEGDDIEEYLQMLDIFEFVDIDDIQAFAAAVKCNGIEDIMEMEDIYDIEDAELDGALAIRLTLGDKEHARDFIESVKELLSAIDIRANRLTTKEVYVTDKEGYVKLHFNIADLVKLILADEDLVEEAEKNLDCELKDLIGDYTGDIGISIEINGADVFILAGGALNTEAKTYNEFLKAFGVSIDPMKLPMNEKIADDIVDLADSGLKYLAKYDSYTLVDDIDDSTVYIPNDDYYFVENKVGISMPTKDLFRWDGDGTNLKKTIEAAGYTVDLQYADNSVSTQVSQIESMINSGCKVLVIAAIDSASMGTVLKNAKDKGITVIAYDRLIMDTADVDYYVSFDNYMAGTMQGEYIRYALDLDNSAGPFYIEITSGDYGDPAAITFYNGAMDVLRPYIDAEKLVVASGQVSFEDTATAGWSTDRARGRAENIIGSYYLDTDLNIDAWLCSNDSVALGVATAIESVPYSGNYPVITGMDCEIANVKNIIAGKQAMSVFKDTRTLVSQTATMVTQILEWQMVDINDNSTANNGKKVIPAFLCSPVFADINNYKAILIDSGYYTADQLG